MRHRARVLSDTNSTDAKSRAWVEVEGISGCQRCASGNGCGAGVFAHGSRLIRLECQTTQQVKQDQQVTIQIDDSGSRWLWLVAGAYGLPTLGLIIATMLATFLLPSVPAVLEQNAPDSDSWREVLIAVAALTGLAGGLFAWRYLSPGVVARLEKGLCLQSARIVAEDYMPVGEY